MPDLSRRKFLVASAGLGAAGLLSGACAVSWPDLMKEATQRPLAEGSGVLVILTMYGGNDGINTVIPYVDNAYHDARPELAYAPGDVLPLDGQLGLNPALRGLPSSGITGSWRLCAGRATRSPTTATSGRWTSGRPLRRPNPSRPDGSDAGWTLPAATRCVRSISVRSFRRSLLVKSARRQRLRRMRN